ncbi:MAG: ABC transporter permease, partial [Streptosporangiaceae bacterium]
RPGRPKGRCPCSARSSAWAFVAVLGLTATGAGQISRQFTVLADTTVTVQDNGPANNVAAPDTNPPIGFPADADAIADHINGVTAAGVWWPVALPDGTDFTGSLALTAAASQTIDMLAASPGAVAAMGLRIVAGSPLTSYENDTGQHVALIDTSTATALGIPAAAHRRSVPGREHGAGHARRADRHLYRRRDRGHLRRGQGLDRGAEPGLHPARAADRQRGRLPGRRVPGAARGADQPAGGVAACVNHGPFGKK